MGSSAVTPSESANAQAWFSLKTFTNAKVVGARVDCKKNTPIHKAAN